MAKPKIVYTCEACGAQTLQWAGQCPDCGGWNTLAETARSLMTVPAARGGYAGEAEVRGLADISLAAEPRTPSGLAELDRVLGGGLVTGAVVLIGGDPGIGKSTLLLQAAAQFGGTGGALYVTGEESLQQVSLRARRLGLADAPMTLLAETCVERIIATALARRPGMLVVDSIQTMYSEALQSVPGAIGQLREATAQLVRMAKHSGISVFVVGHVTKEGTLAGPRVLEHMVDTVLYFETDLGSRYRVIRAVKNRFGAVNELGVFAMADSGLKEVKNPSAIFLSRHDTPVSGSVIMVTREGSRPLLVEVQALVDGSHGSNPRRVTVGLEQNRLSMLLAVLHRHGGVAMLDQDVFVNVVGGLRVSETAADLPVLLAALSSLRDRPVPADVVVFGEVGLAGEIRPVYNGEERLREAAKHGFTRAIVPTANAPKKGLKGMEIIRARRLADVLDVV